MSSKKQKYMHQKRMRSKEIIQFLLEVYKTLIIMIDLIDQN